MKISQMFMRGATMLAGLTLAFSGMAVVSAQEAPIETPPVDAVVMNGSLTVNKITVGGDDTFSFSGEGISPFEITTSEGEGSYVVENLTPGFYIVTEGTLPTGWSQTENTCDDNDGGITVGAGPTTTCTITNTYNPPIPTYSISGIVYHDNSPQNGQLDEGENGLEGWRVYVDKPIGDGEGNNEFDGDESFDFSDADGVYTISGLTRGCYTVREELQGGWNETQPTEVEEYEYDFVCVGRDVSRANSVVDKALGYIFKTANAADAMPVDSYGLNFGNVEQPRSGGSSGSRPKKDDSSSTTDQGQVLGDSTNIPLVQPLVLGATLPVTGNPTWVLLMIVLFAAPMLYFRKLAVKNN